MGLVLTAIAVEMLLNGVRTFAALCRSDPGTTDPVEFDDEPSGRKQVGSIPCYSAGTHQLAHQQVGEFLRRNLPARGLDVAKNPTRST